MNLVTSIEKAIEQTNKVAARAITRVTNQASRYTSQEDLEAAYATVIETHTRTLRALNTALESVRGAV